MSQADFQHSRRVSERIRIGLAFFHLTVAGKWRRLTRIKRTPRIWTVHIGPLAASVRKFTVGARSATLRSGGDAGSRQRRLCRERPAGMPDRAFSFTTTPQQPVDG